MRGTIGEALNALAEWLSPVAAAKALPRSYIDGPSWTTPSFVDSYKLRKNPSPSELMAELKNTAWTCASINASVCATFPPKLYVTTHAGQARPRCLTRPLARAQESAIRKAGMPERVAKALHIEQVVEHPLLDLLVNVNPVHNAFDLWELTDLYLEVLGKAFWLLEFDPLLGVPRAIWPLPAQNVTPRRRADSEKLIDCYEYRNGASTQIFAEDEVIFFRFPDPKDPYLGGLSPLRASFEQTAFLSELMAMKSAVLMNQALPSAIVSPSETMAEEDRDRLEARWNQRFRQGGSGRVLFAESDLSVSILSQSLGDLAALAEMGATQQDICNAFHVPISFLTSQTNLANLQASEYQHASKAIGPRLQRRDEKLNQQLVPLFDPSGRLFVWSDDPIPLNRDYAMLQEKQDLTLGVRSINQVRAERGEPPVPWGDRPWLPTKWEQKQ